MTARSRSLRRARFSARGVSSGALFFPCDNTSPLSALYGISAMSEGREAFSAVGRVCESQGKGVPLGGGNLARLRESLSGGPSPLHRGERVTCATKFWSAQKKNGERERERERERRAFSLADWPPQRASAKVRR